VKRFLCAFSLTVLALSIRLYPTTLSGLPFSTDSWPIVGNVKLLLENSPIKLDDPMMDGYNCYWPASSLYASTFSLVTGLSALDGSSSIPFAGAMAALILYTLALRLSGSRRIAFYASTLAASFYPYAFFTAGVTKETFASPLYMLTLLLSTLEGGIKTYTLLAIASTSLALSHHLTTLVALLVLASSSLASLASGFRKGLSWRSLIPPAILSASAALDFTLYANRGFKITLAPSDILSASSYQLLFFTIAAYYTIKPNKSSRTLLTPLTSAAAVSLIAFLSTVRPILPEAPVLPTYYLLYSTPFIACTSLAALGLPLQKASNRLPLFWLSSTLALEAYSAFGSPPLGLALACRTLNFLSTPLALSSAFGLHRLKALKRDILAPSILFTLLTLNVYNVYSAVSLGERYMGYFWLYRMPEYEAASWLSPYNGTVSSDVKFSYLLEGYFKVKVDVTQALKYLSGKGSSPKLMLFYNQMLEKGYVLYGGYSVSLPSECTKRLYSLSNIYSNGQVKILRESP